MDPLFMSAEHVALMNERLASSSEVAEAATHLSRSYAVAYRLLDARADRVEHWLMQLGPEGVRFSLDPAESADLTFVGDYWQMITASRTPGGGEDAEMQTIGDPDVLATIAEVFGVAQRVGAVPVRWPE